ncbi:hypothetical protein [Ammoniphilus sp. YIM 78166]|uniref:hypothetical protein n=1 Tax=Ammoniphilus sp. YIM 78166 TaxID=1644106 RepID=UPI00143182C7|nr:hypothetical protein [Ammoniphilus sp. YIM 78166]
MDPKHNRAISLHHYNSVRDPNELQEGRVEGLNVYEALLRPNETTTAAKKK